MNDNTIDYLLVGHITADLLPDGGRLLGGTVSYSARTAHAFGLRVGVLTSAAPDEPLLDELRDYAQIHIVPGAHTTTFENIYHEGGRSQYIRAVATPITRADVPAHWRSASLVHLGPIADETAAGIVHDFADATVMMTLQGWLRRWDADGRVGYKRWFDADVLRAVDLLVFSEEDINGDRDLEHDIARLTRRFVLTRADYGGTYYDDGQPETYDAYPAQVVNPTGAGDIFATSLLCAWHRLGGDIRDAVDVAAKLAAFSVTRLGLESAPTPDEISEALRHAARSAGGKS